LDEPPPTAGGGFLIHKQGNEMSVLETLQDKDQPPDALIEALDIVAAWEHGASVSTPEALAIHIYLQRATINRQAGAAALMLTEV
jgi:hypothetical protein